MQTELIVLDHTGHESLTWDHDDAEDRERARQLIADLKAAGYSFFLVDGTPADEVTAGQGKLLVRKLTAEQVTESPEQESPAAEPEPKQQPKKRGRPRRQVVATRPMAGG